MVTHEQKVNRIVQQLKNRKSTEPVSLKKKAVTHQVPKPQDKRYDDEKIDLSDLNEIIKIDYETQTCVAEPGVTFVDLINATLKYNLVPFTVPELKTITIGGAVAGGSLESMSFKYGGFHDSCLEYEVITATGDVLTCTPENENRLIFQMLHGTFGTLGIISRITFKLIPAKTFVKVIFEKYNNLEDYKKATWHHYQNKDVDFMDGIIHSPKEYVLCLANFVDEAPYAHNYDWTRVYYQITKTQKEDYLKTADYFFRYEAGVTNVWPRSFLGRLFLGKFLDTTAVLKIVEKFRKFIASEKIPITIDLFIPFSRLTNFFEWYEKEMNHFPLWWVPYKIIRRYEWISSELFNQNQDELFVDVAIYGMKNNDGRNYYRMMEEKLMSIGGIKTLISNNYYSEKEFWGIWNKKNYDEVKRQTDPNNIFRNLYTKTCKTMMGLD